MTRSVIVPVCLTFALACNASEPGGDTDDGTTDATDSSGDDSTDTGDGDGDGDGDTDTGAEVVATIEGTIADMAGMPLPTPGLQFCGPVSAEGNVEACIPETVDETGAFAINAMKAGKWNLKIVHGNVDGRYFCGHALELTVNPDDTLDLSPTIVVPEVSDAQMTDLSAAVGETTVVIDDVLSIVIDPALAQSPDFQMPSELGGLAVPEEFWRITEVEGGTVIAAWSFSAFGIKATEGNEFGFMISGNLGLAADDTLSFYAVRKDTAWLQQVATGTVTADATSIDIVSVGEGLHELTWLLAVQ